jgi:nucleotide-binding universal stress UspA family protein
MYHVLLAIDTNPGRAETLANAVLDLPEPSDHVRATVFHCFGDNPEGTSINQLRSARHAVDTLEEAGIEVSLKETSGDPVNEIVDAAEDLAVDVIYLAGRKKSPTGKVLFGSVTQGVALGTDRPVLICGHE